MFDFSQTLFFPELTYSFSDAFFVYLHHSKDSKNVLYATKAKSLAWGGSCYRGHNGTNPHLSNAITFTCVAHSLHNRIPCIKYKYTQ